jgi:hypothetical protein
MRLLVLTMGSMDFVEHVGILVLTMGVRVLPMIPMGLLLQQVWWIRVPTMGVGLLVLLMLQMLWVVWMLWGGLIFFLAYLQMQHLINPGLINPGIINPGLVVYYEN